MNSSTRFARLELLVPKRNWAWRQPGNDWINERRTYHTMNQRNVTIFFWPRQNLRLIVLGIAINCSETNTTLVDSTVSFQMLRTLSSTQTRVSTSTTPAPKHPYHLQETAPSWPIRCALTTVACPQPPICWTYITVQQSPNAVCWLPILPRLPHSSSEIERFYELSQSQTPSQKVVA